MRRKTLNATDELITEVASTAPTESSVHALVRRHGVWPACTALLVRRLWVEDIETPAPPRVCTSKKGVLPS